MDDDIDTEDWFLCRSPGCEATGAVRGVPWCCDHIAEGEEETPTPAPRPAARQLRRDLRNLISDAAEDAETGLSAVEVDAVLEGVLQERRARGGR